MRKDALQRFVLAGALFWLSVIPGRAGADWPPAGCTPPVGGVPVYMMPNMAMPVRAQPQPTQWQAPRMPPPAQLASGVNSQPLPAKVRGVSADPPPKFVLPSPEALGVTANLNLSQPAAPKAKVDWNQIQARMERLGVLRYEKDRAAGGVRVLMLLPTSDPTRGQPVEAHAETEAVAIVMALDAAEAWMKKR